MKLFHKRLTGRKPFTITDSLFILYEPDCLFNIVSTGGPPYPRFQLSTVGRGPPPKKKKFVKLKK